MKTLFSDERFCLCLEPIGPLGTNVGFILDEKAHRLAVVDAPPDSWNFSQNHFSPSEWTLTQLFLTHGHWDHMADASRFADAQALLWAGKGDELFFRHPEIMEAFGPKTCLAPCRIGHWLVNGELCEIFPTLSLRALHVPGHSPGSFAYVFPQISIAFVGDTLFADSIGRSDLPGGDEERLLRSIREQLYALPDETCIVPGHGPLSSILQEKRHNPHVRA
ncbi:MAG: MBL fold metallo-hydrolase [Puniceicoccales bacterium]|jgi:glyoxylase-like metal-dependent hydrolase (beta-lactamase superfamily II)|nr:MBL fold metallo-hydrolase [Puniceicoccales bacterium]